MSDAEVLREIFSLDDGQRVFVREPVAHVEQRARLLRTCALLARVQCESYERRMPPPEWRTYRDLDAQARHAAGVSGSVCRLVSRIDGIAPGGAMRQWGEAVDAVRALTLEEAERELMSLPPAP